MCATRFLRISAANIGSNRFHQNRTVSWLMSIPRSARRSSTLRSDSGYFTYIITTRRMTSGELNIEQWVRSRRGASLPVGSAVPHRLQPEEAMPVPIRAGDRLGNLRKAAVDATIPGVPVVEDHDPLQTAVPFPNQQSSGLEPDALARRRPAGCKGRSAPRLERFVPGLAQTPQDRSSFWAFYAVPS